MATSGITLSAALRSNLLSLQGTQRLLDQTQLRLATGLKVNSALDDPNAFFAAQSLNNRAGDLSRLLDGIGQSVQTLKAADEGIKSLTSLLEQAQSVAQEASDQAGGSGGAVTSVSLEQSEIDDLDTFGTIADGDNFTVTVGSGPTTTITINTGTTLQEVADDLNTIAGIQATIEPSDSVAGEYQLRIQSLDGQEVTIADGTQGTAATQLGIVGAPAIAANTAAPADQASLQQSYDQILSQIDALVSDAGYRGVNLLNGGSLTVTFNEDGTSTLAITGVSFDSAGLGISAANFSSTGDINNAIDEIENALDTVRAQARTFGNNLSIIQTREDFTRNLINTLQEGADKLTLADKNEEGANLLALQTAQQLGITSLSLASQANQSVLRLFG